MNLYNQNREYTFSFHYLMVLSKFYELNQLNFHFNYQTNYISNNFLESFNFSYRIIQYMKKSLEAYLLSNLFV